MNNGSRLVTTSGTREEIVSDYGPAQPAIYTIGQLLKFGVCYARTNQQNGGRPQDRQKTRLKHIFDPRNKGHKADKRTSSDSAPFCLNPSHINNSGADSIPIDSFLGSGISTPCKAR